MRPIRKRRHDDRAVTRLSTEALRQVRGGGIGLSPVLPARLAGGGGTSPSPARPPAPAAVQAAVRRFIAESGSSSRARARRR